MILFKDDWQLYPSAIVDDKTTNTSFLRYAEYLHRKGVSNNLFPLALFQPSLQGVDPYSEDLTLEQKYAIADECTYNPWYFFREVMRIPPIAGLDPVPFIANKGNMSMFWSYFNHIDYLLIQIRQTGKSVSTDCLNTWLMHFGMRNSRMLLITKDDTLRRENILRLRKMRSYFPKWLVYDDPTDANNQSELTYNTRGNIYRTAVGQNSEDAANNVGRGASVATLHDDEPPFTPFIDVTLPAALTAGNAARTEAEKNGMPYGNIFTTTAGKIDSRSGGFFYNNYYLAAAPWTDGFYDLNNIDDLRTTVKNRSKGDTLLILGEFNHKQLGYTDKWLYDAIANAKTNDLDKIDRDFFNRWTSGGISSPLPTEILEKLSKHQKEPDYVEITKERFTVSWYHDEDEHRKRTTSQPIILGVDTSDAIGRDDISITFTGAYDLKVIGRIDVNQVSLLTASAFVAGILITYPNTILVIEKKSSAQTFIDAAIATLLLHGQDPLKRIFNRIIQERETNRKVYEEIEKVPLARRRMEHYEKYRHLFGFNTTGATRDTLYREVLTSAAKRTCTHIYDRTLSGQLRRLVTKNGRIDHAAGGHDDAVISWLLTHWFLMYGAHLSHYGIDTSRILIRVGEDGKVGTQKELYEQNRQAILRDQFDATVEKLKVTSNVHLLIRLEADLRIINKMLVESGTEPISIDAILNDAKKNRAQSLMQRKLGHANNVR